MILNTPERKETNAGYHAGLAHYSHSMLEIYRKSPPRFEAIYITKTLSRPPSTPAMALGSLLHCLVLEPDELENVFLIVECKERKGNVWKAAVADAALRGQEPVPRPWLENAEAMAAAHVGGIRRAVLNAPGHVTLSLAGDPLDEAVKVMRKRTAVTNAQMDALADTYGVHASKVAGTFENHVNRKLIKTVAELTIEGVHIAEAKSRLAVAFEELGMMPDNSFTLEGIFRTEMAKAYSAGSYIAEQDEAIQDILWGYKYVTVGDNRVRSEHAGFDGVTLSKDDPFWDVNRPPVGWACRCECIPLFDKAKEAKPRAVDVDGKMVTPKAEPGFDVNFGKVLSV